MYEDDVRSVAQEAYLRLEEARRAYLEVFKSMGYVWVSGGLHPEDHWNLWVHKDLMEVGTSCRKDTCSLFLSELKRKLGVSELPVNATLPNYIYYTEET